MRTLPIFFSLLCLLGGEVSLRAQVVVGGREFVRATHETGAKGEWVLYEKGAPRNDGTRRWLTRRVLAELGPGTPASTLAAVPGVVGTTLRGRYAVLEFAGGPSAAIDGAIRVRKVAGVRSAEPMLARQLHRRFEPDDPLFAYDASRPGYQWHVKNTGQGGAEAGVDVNVAAAWDTYRGAGVRVAIVDDGLEVDHPDLAANVDLVNDHDFNDNDNDPSPGPDDFHGTACAGVAAARGNNGIGVAGVAPEAILVGLRLIAAPTTDLEEADAFAHASDIIAVKSNSWGPYDFGFAAEGPGPLSRTALETAATTGRGGLGTVFLWAAGNGEGSGDDSNYDGWANSIHAIAVGAVNDKGRRAWYSEPGANILVCAPSGGGTQDITTTDRTGLPGYNSGESLPEHPDYADPDYTNTFSGTSSATPAVAGVVALMLQANPNLTPRDVQEILVRTAQRNDYYDAWVINGAGYHFHHHYGAGLVDAKAATDLAGAWTNLDPCVSHTIAATGLPIAIPDYDEEGVTRTFTVPPEENLRLEHVTVRVKATHPNRGNLQWQLTSPSGVTVCLARARFLDSSADLEWTFMATHFWGERSEGEWKLQVSDLSVDEAGMLDEAAITFHGTPAEAALPLPVITSDRIVVGREGAEMDYRVTASNFPTSYGATGLPDGLTVDAATGIISGTPTGAGLWYGTLDATNATGAVSEFAYFLILAADPDLSEALDQPDTKIVPFGHADAFRQTAIAHDGIDAAQTASVDHEEWSGIEFTVEGPASISFYWKISSEQYYDYLVFGVDGWVRDYISGEVDWTQVTTWVGPGTHNVDIYYIKDQAVAKGTDAGWIDDLVIESTKDAVPVVTEETIQAYEGIYFRHAIEATNAPTTYTAVDLPPGLTLHAGTGLIYGTVAAAGTYRVTVQAANDYGSGSATITIAVGTLAQGLAEAVDNPALTITTSGEQTWTPQWLYAHDRDDAARSGPIAGSQQSVMATEIVGPCKVTFYWGVSSEKDCDILRFTIDDVERAAISGETGWTRMAFILPAGTHSLRWVYSKDAAVDAGLDCGLVDQIETHVDLDRDGVYTDDEIHFGTSDADPTDFPRPAVALGASGATFTFPSVPGNEYRVEWSDDLENWRATIVEATGSSTSWIDAAAPSKPRRFYRVRIP